MRGLAAGGAGFLGSHLCDNFLKKGAKVIAVDNLITGSMTNIEHLINNPRFEFIGSSNWVAVATTRRELFGVVADGSLWKAAWSERVDKNGHIAPLHTGISIGKDAIVRAAALRLERVGSESDWSNVAASWQHCVALKRDGTIWGCGNNGNRQLGDNPIIVTNDPVQIGQAANWTAVYVGNGHSYAVNRDNEIWKWGRFEQNIHPRKIEGPVKLNIKVPGVRDVISANNDCELILDTDGNLWGLGRIPPALSGEEYSRQYYSEPKRLGGTNWLAVSYSWQALIGQKADGTLWIQRGHDFYNWPLPKLTQLGKRTDWIAVESEWEADVALAKDGTIYRFGEPFTPGNKLLAPPAVSPGVSTCSTRRSEPSREPHHARSMFHRCQRNSNRLPLCG